MLNLQCHYPTKFGKPEYVYWALERTDGESSYLVIHSDESFDMNINYRGLSFLDQIVIPQTAHYSTSPSACRYRKFCLDEIILLQSQWFFFDFLWNNNFKFCSYIGAGCTEINIKDIGILNYGKYKCYVKVQNQELVTSIKPYEIKAPEGKKNCFAQVQNISLQIAWNPLRCVVFAY